MTTARGTARAYQATSVHRSLKEQEAEVFRQANAGLKRVRRGSTVLARVRALADNERLWLTLIGTLQDPANRLPEMLRGSIISVGIAVQREMRAKDPDLDFLIDINENIAIGLAGPA